MAAIVIKLGERPQTFSPFPVKFPMPTGGEGAIEWTYKYRTRSEYAEFLDGLVEANRTAAEVKPAAAKKKAKAGADDAPAAREVGYTETFFKATTDSQVRHVLQIADGWNLPEPFTAENIEKLCDTMPGAVSAAIDAYRSACVEGRLGN
jgi:hypothetical protein